MTVLHLYCSVKDSAGFLFLGCSPTCLWICLFKFRPALMPETPLWRSVDCHCCTAQTLARHPAPCLSHRLVSIPPPVSASVRGSLVTVTVAHSAPYGQERLLSTGSNLYIATGLCPAVWDGLGQRVPIVPISCVCWSDPR